MSVTRGGGWGRLAPLPADAPVVAGDAALADLVTPARRAGVDPPVVGLVGGDLCRTLGGGGDPGRLRGDRAVTAVVDIGRVTCDDGTTAWFVAHLVARRRAWQGPFAVVMNAQWLGPLDLGPRAHPGDGLLDLTEGRLGLRDRLTARRRARTGSHLPHPALRTARSGTHRFDLGHPTPVLLDGRRLGRFRTLRVDVEPDSLTVVVAP